jgi:hypothetical protein
MRHRRHTDVVRLDEAIESAQVFFEQMRAVFEQLAAALSEALDQWAQALAPLAEQLRGLYPDVVIVDDLDPWERGCGCAVQSGEVASRRQPTGVFTYCRRTARSTC